MTAWRALALLLPLAACDRPPPAAQENAGTRLEHAAVQAGIVADPAHVDLVGAWARDTDRLCIVPMAGRDRRIGVLLDYGQGQGCAASGTVRQHGDTATVAFGGCTFTARIDGDRITFPAELPSACDAPCTGRASLSALSVDRVSASASEAAQLRTPAGRALCGG